MLNIDYPRFLFANFLIIVILTNLLFNLSVADQFNLARLIESDRRMLGIRARDSVDHDYRQAMDTLRHYYRQTNAVYKT